MIISINVWPFWICVYIVKKQKSLIKIFQWNNLILTLLSSYLNGCTIAWCRSKDMASRLYPDTPYIIICTMFNNQILQNNFCITYGRCLTTLMLLYMSLRLTQRHPIISITLWWRINKLIGFLRSGADCPITNKTNMLPTMPRNKGTKSHCRRLIY